MRQKYTSLFLFLILMLNLLIFIPGVSAIERFEDFDDLELDSFLDNGWMEFVQEITQAKHSGVTDNETYSSSARAWQTGGGSVVNGTADGNITKFSFMMYITGDFDEGSVHYIALNHETFSGSVTTFTNGIAVLRIQGLAGPNFATYSCGRDLGWDYMGEQLPKDDWYKITIEIIDEDTVIYTVGAVSTGEIETTREITDDVLYLRLNSYYGGFPIYMDDLALNAYGPGSGEGTDTVNFEIYDAETGDRMNSYGHDIIKDVDNYYLYTELHSDLWEGDYNSYGSFGDTITIEDINISISGEWHYFNMTYIVGFIDPDIKYYLNVSNYIKMYPGQTYTIYISDSEDSYGGYSNCASNRPYGTFAPPSEDPKIGLCTDNIWYVQGESINIRYICPTPIQLFDRDLPAAGWNIWIYDVDNLGWLWWTTDGGISADNYDYLDDWSVSLTGNFRYLHWDFDPGETFGYKTVTDGIDHYKMYIAFPGSGWFSLDRFLIQGPEFYITAGEYTPHGNITSLSPSDPMLGQFVTIGFEANNNGYLTVKNVLAPDDTEETITNFQKFEGIETVTRQFFEFGSYELKLYVSSGLEFEVVDTETFDITDINGSFGDFGFGIEFLTVEPERAIAGYDILFINYRSLDETGEIKVMDARGQTTSYGTIVGEKRGVLNITLPNHAAIGEWNVSLTTANNTLYSSFNVIAEENNWVEFYSNVYIENQQFELKLKHDKKIELVFYKDGQAIGTDWYLDTGIFPSGIYPVPFEKVTLSPGSWKVEMWQVNNFVKIKKLAEDICVVIEVPPGSLTEGGDQNIFQILTAGASSFADGEFGLAFMAIIFILVVIIILAQYKLKNDTIFFGGILIALFMAFIGWLPVWIVILAIVISGILFSNAFSKKLGIGS